jgi:hypothetical protein
MAPCLEPQRAIRSQDLTAQLWSRTYLWGLPWRSIPNARQMRALLLPLIGATRHGSHRIPADDRPCPRHAERPQLLASATPARTGAGRLGTPRLQRPGIISGRDMPRTRVHLRGIHPSSWRHAMACDLSPRGLPGPWAARHSRSPAGGDHGRWTRSPPARSGRPQARERRRRC